MSLLLAASPSPAAWRRVFRFWLVSWLLALMALGWGAALADWAAAVRETPARLLVVSAADLTQDGAVGAADLLLARQHLGEAVDPALGWAALAAGDVNLDGRVDVLDLARIAQSTTQ